LDAADVEDEAVEAVAAVAMDQPESGAAVVPTPVIIRPPNGTNYPLQNATRFAKSVTRKEKRVATTPVSVRSPICQ